MLGAVILVSLIGCIILRTPLVVNLFRSSVSTAYTEMQQTAVVLMIMASAVMYILILVAVTYGILIYMGVHFYKSMYTDEGYLTHTLPVTGHQLLLSKLFASSLWQLIISVAVMLSVLAIVASVGVSAAEASSIWGTVDYATFFREVGNLFGEMFDSLGGTAVRMIVEGVLLILISPLISMSLLFGALTLGQLSGKHKLLMGILAYVGSFIVYSMIFSIAQFVTMFASMQTYDAMGNAGFTISSYESSLLIGILISVGYYFLSHFIITKKLNMD